MNLTLDKNAFDLASSELAAKCEELSNLRKAIDQSLSDLKRDWDSEAGKKFFEKFENDLQKNLDEHSAVLKYMSNNLTTASQKYEEVFRAADAVASVQY